MPIIENLWKPQQKKNLDSYTINTIKAIMNKIPQLPLAAMKVIEMTSDMDTNIKVGSDRKVADIVVMYSISR